MVTRRVPVHGFVYGIFKNWYDLFMHLEIVVIYLLAAGPEPAIDDNQHPTLFFRWMANTLKWRNKTLGGDVAPCIHKSFLGFLPPSGKKALGVGYSKRLPGTRTLIYLLI